MLPRKDPHKVRTFKIHVSNISKDLGQAELKLMFEPFGRIVECEVFKKAFAFVHMEEEECGRAAIKELHNKVIEGQVMAVTASNNTEPPNIATTKLEVKNVATAVTPHILRSLFQKFGMVLECEVRLGQGIVSLEATGDIRSAINEMNGFLLEGKTLEVEACKVKKFPSTGGNPKFAGPSFRPGQQRRQYDQGIVNRNYHGPIIGGRGRGFANSNNCYDDDQYYGPPGPQTGFYGGPPNFRSNNGGGYQNPNMVYRNQEFQEEFGGGYSMNEDFRDDGNYYEDNGLPDGYFPPPRPFQQPPVREVAPGEAYPPPLKLARFMGPGQNGAKPLMKRGERGGRNKMTTGKIKMVQALTASGVNVPRNYIPELMNGRGGPPPRFMNDGEGESPNMLPVAGFRGFRVPMPQFGGPRTRGPGPGPMTRPRAPMAPTGLRGPIPGAVRPVFRNPMSAPVGRLLPPNIHTYRPTPPSQIQRMPAPRSQVQWQAPPNQVQRMQAPQSIMDIDFTADIDCY